MQAEKCVGNCGRDIAVGQTIFQVYLGGYWSTYITPDRGRWLGNWCVDCFRRDYGRLVGSQVQPYECSLCGRRFKEHELVIYATRGTRPAPLAERAELRGAELPLIVGEECWADDHLPKLYEICDLQASPIGLEGFLKGLQRANADPTVDRKVRHSDFGIGTVVGVEGYNDDRRISVSFPGRGIRKLVERFAQLEWL